MDATSSPDLLLTVEEVASRLRVSRATVDRLVKTERFPAPIKFGGAVQRFKRADVEAFLEQHTTREPLLARTRKASRRKAKK